MSEERNVRRDGMPRRVALRVIGGGVPAALAVGKARGVRAAQSGEATAAEGGSEEYAWQFLTESERKAASVLADMILPADDVSGSATEAGAVEYVDEWVSYWGDASQIQVRGGLTWLNRECYSRFGVAFVDCQDAERRQVLDDIAYPEKLPPEPEEGAAPAAPVDAELERLRHGIEFFSLFRDLVAGAFYTSRMGIDDLRYEGNAPVSWNGCPPHVLRKLGLEG